MVLLSEQQLVDCAQVSNHTLPRLYKHLTVLYTRSTKRYSVCVLRKITEVLPFTHLLLVRACDDVRNMLYVCRQHYYSVATTHT
jgi:hypothetical protein